MSSDAGLIGAAHEVEHVRVIALYGTLARTFDLCSYALDEDEAARPAIDE
jgi:ferritin-like metal-binding protein YciE